MNDYMITYTLMPSQRCRQYLVTNVDSADIARKIALEEITVPKNQTMTINTVELG